MADIVNERSTPLTPPQPVPIVSRRRFGAAYLLLAEYLSQATEHWKMIFGPLLVLVVLFAKGGLIGMTARLFGRRK